MHHLSGAIRKGRIDLVRSLVLRRMHSAVVAKPQELSDLQKTSATERFPPDFVSAYPVKPQLRRRKLTQPRYKPQELTVQETPPKVKGVVALEENAPASIYAGITRNTLDQIKNIDLDGYVGVLHYLLICIGPNHKICYFGDGQLASRTLRFLSQESMPSWIWDEFS